MAGSQDLTLGAAATPTFLEKTKRRTWVKHRPFLSLLMNDEITDIKKARAAKIRALRDEVSGKAEYFRVTAEVYELTGGGLVSRGSTLGSGFAVVDTDVYGDIVPADYVQPWALSARDIDVGLPAKGHEQQVGALADRMISASLKLGDLISAALMATSQESGHVESLLCTMFKASGTSSGINSATHTAWKAVANDANEEPVGIDQMGGYVRAGRRNSKGIDTIVCGGNQHEIWLAEAKARNLNIVSVIDAFGKDERGNNKLAIETDYETIKIAGCPVIYDTDLDTNSPTTIFYFDRSAIGLKAVPGRNFTPLGPMDVQLEAAVDQVRAAVFASVIAYTTDRSALGYVYDAAV